MSRPPVLLGTSARIVLFVSKQDSETVLHKAQAVRDGKLVIPIDRPLWDAVMVTVPLKRAESGTCCSLLMNNLELMRILPNPLQENLIAE